MELDVAVAKVGKYAVSESGDTMEMIERPHGGLSFVLVDGQRSGKGAKAISNLVSRKAVSLLADGVRDGAAARAAHDYLYTLHSGKVSATLDIVSVDLVTRTIVLSRNSHCAPFIATRAGLRALGQPSQPVGIYARTKPIITELALEAGLTIVVYTDGLPSAGERKGQPLGPQLPDMVRELTVYGDVDAPTVADALLAAALAADDNRPGDDISILVLAVIAHQGDDARRLAVRVPIPPLPPPRL